MQFAGVNMNCSSTDMGFRVDKWLKIAAAHYRPGARGDPVTFAAKELSQKNMIAFKQAFSCFYMFTDLSDLTVELTIDIMPVFEFLFPIFNQVFAKILQSAFHFNFQQPAVPPVQRGLVARGRHRSRIPSEVRPVVRRSLGLWGFYPIYSLLSWHQC